MVSVFFFLFLESSKPTTRVFAPVTRVRGFGFFPLTLSQLNADDDDG